MGMTTGVPVAVCSLGEVPKLKTTLLIVDKLVAPGAFRTNTTEDPWAAVDKFVAAVAVDWK